MEGINIREYRESDWQKFREYITEAFNEKNVLRDEKFFKWQYDGGFFIAEAKDKIIGHFGFRDFDYKFRDEKKKVRVLMNLFTLEDYRALGIGTLLAKKVFETENPILVSGYTIHSQKLFSRLDPNWQEAGNLKRMIASFDAFAPFIEDYKSPNLASPVNQSSEFEIKEGNEFDSKYDDLWKEVRNRYQITAERTAEYLSWRFKKHPHFEYRIIEIYKDSKLNGFLVWRMEEDQNFRIARIIDFVCLEHADKFLLLEFLNNAQFKGAHAADFMFSGDLYDSALIENGFFNITGTEFEKFPILFSPIAYKKTIINIAYNFGISLNDCFLTKADGDQDRPNRV